LSAIEVVTPTIVVGIAILSVVDAIGKKGKSA
jgi:hypothetical protein